jgi:hypothetical protein
MLRSRGAPRRGAWDAQRATAGGLGRDPLARRTPVGERLGRTRKSTLDSSYISVKRLASIIHINQHVNRYLLLCVVSTLRGMSRGVLK